MLPLRTRVVGLLVAGTACLAAAGCGSGQLNQQQKEHIVSDSGHASRNDMQVAAVFLDGPVSQGGIVYGHFVLVNNALAADVLESVSSPLGSGQLLSGVPGYGLGATPSAVPSASSSGGAASASASISVSGSPSGSASTRASASSSSSSSSGASAAALTSAPVETVTVPGNQGRALVNWFAIPMAASGQLVGSTVTVTFTFEKAGAIDVYAPVVPGTPGAYNDQTQEQRGQDLGVIGPDGQGLTQQEGLMQASESAAAAAEASAAATRQASQAPTASASPSAAAGASSAP